MMKISNVLLTVNILLLVFIWIFIAMEYKGLPEIIPSHFAVNGTVDGESEKRAIWFLPAVATFIFLLLVGIPKDPNSPLLNVPDSYRNKESLRLLMYSILLPVLLLFGDIIVESIWVAQGKLTEMTNAVFVLLSLLLIVIGANIFCMIKKGKLEQ
ncbi:DUF1648 domain-containing protein [Chryseobacterium daecheongense]|uniref:DUF1648 domain-containing protein n=1 Tax=Chryseobacterium daecheongense TaxID=192389 RepID=A0A3N0VVG1_9FLAO|nr:DUF1648 domain-containing protein [Chryseobacterium daecheongense]ROH96754.1 DUF1648 domain-containing protein [Chryseobacterium daecheongense]TDX90765.1 uncharacterized protein DUF1648 [Chryseobacterium daecheongense]